MRNRLVDNYINHHILSHKSSKKNSKYGFINKVLKTQHMHKLMCVKSIRKNIQFRIFWRKKTKCTHGSASIDLSLAT